MAQPEVVPKKQQKTYDEQVILTYRYSFTDDRAKNAKYKLVEKNTGKILAEGWTDDRGMTERVCTEKPEYVDIIIIRPNEKKQEEEKNISMFKTNDKKESYYIAIVGKGRIFFDIRYVNPEKDAAKSFIKAAETQKRKAWARGFDEYNEGDVWWSFEVTTECDITTAWQKIYDLQQRYDMKIEEGHIFTHASKNGDLTGLTFATIGCTEDGTLSLAEIKNLPKLKWSNNSTLFLYGCRTGLHISEKDNRSIADVFFENQDINTTKALMGYGYFSYSPTTYQAIADVVGDTKDIYLLAYNRRQNISKYKAALGKAGREDRVDIGTGEGFAMPQYTRSR